MVDMGGVLSHHEDKSMERKILRFLGDRKHDSFEEIDPVLSTNLLDSMSSLEIGEDEYWKRFTKISGIPVPDMHGESLWGKFFSPVINQEVLACIKAAKGNGIRVVLASNTEPPHVKFHMARGDYQVFDAVYTSCILRCAKPNPEFFQKIIDREAADPKDMFFSDDNQQNCASAAALGIHAYLYKDPVSLEAELIKRGIILNHILKEQTNSMS